MKKTKIRRMVAMTARHSHRYAGLIALLGITVLKNGKIAKEGSFVVTKFCRALSSGISVLFALALLPGAARTYGQQITWAEAIGERAGDADSISTIIERPDGGFLLAGHTEGWDTVDLRIVRVDAHGKVESAIALDLGGFESARSIASLVGGGFVVAGWSKPFSSEGARLWILKYGESGHIEWQEMLPSGPNDFPSLVRETKDGGFLLVATIMTPTQTTGCLGQICTDAMVAKFDALGNLVWQKFYGKASSMEFGSSVLELSDGVILLAGDTLSDTNPTNHLFLLWLRPDGSILKQVIYESTYSHSPSTIVRVPGGFVINGGYLNDATGEEGILLLKVDDQGIPLWAEGIGSEGEEFLSGATTMVATESGELVMTGATEGFGAGSFDIWLCAADSQGEILWQKTYGSADQESPTQIINTADRGFALTGSTAAMGLVLKVDTEGTVEGCQASGLGNPSYLSSVPIEFSFAEGDFIARDGTATVIPTNAVERSIEVPVQYLCQARLAFSGLFRPVENPPKLNVAKAGSAIPVKFSLNGNQGLDIFASGYPKSQGIACDSSAPLGDVTETDTSGSSGLTYDVSSDQYKYVWKTDGAWSGTCRQLILRLVDGTEHIANFKFSK